MIKGKLIRNLCLVSGRMKPCAINEEMPSDLQLTGRPETEKGQGVVTETHSHPTVLCHWGRWSPAGCLPASGSETAVLWETGKNPGSGITGDIKFVRSLDSEVCSLDNLIQLGGLSRITNAHCKHAVASKNSILQWKVTCKKLRKIRRLAEER